MWPVSTKEFWLRESVRMAPAPFRFSLHSLISFIFEKLLLTKMFQFYVIFFFTFFLFYQVRVETQVENVFQWCYQLYLNSSFLPSNCCTKRRWVHNYLTYYHGSLVFKQIFIVKALSLSFPENIDKII